MAAAVWLVLAGSLVRWVIRSRNSARVTRNPIADGLEQGFLRIERFGVEAVLLLSNGDTLALHDDVAQVATEAVQPRLVVRDRIGLRTFSVSGRKRWAFGGEVLALPKPIKLFTDPRS